MTKQFWHIVPTKFISNQNFHISDTQLVLGHLILKDKEYVKECLKWKEAGGKIVVDNGYYELRRNLTEKEILKINTLVQPDVFVIHDLPFRFNLKFMYEYTIKRLKERGMKSKFLACVYAKNDSFKTDLKQFNTMNGVEGLDIIAIPYSFIKELEFKRHDFLKMIDKECGDKINKHIHLFGVSNIQTLKQELSYKWVNSFDTTFPFKNGFYNVKFPIKNPQDKKRPTEYFNIEKLDDKQEECIYYNLKYFKQEYVTPEN